MNLFPNIEKAYSQDNISAREAQRLAEYIAFGPLVFQTSRLMLKFGLLDLLRDGEKTHAQLVALGGSYARMDRIQASAAGGIA